MKKNFLTANFSIETWFEKSIYFLMNNKLLQNSTLISLNIKYNNEQKTQ